jgi:hypothetical protein
MFTAFLRRQHELDMKIFAEELEKFIGMIEQGKPFARGRFADGEGCILLNMDEAQGGWLERPRLTATWKHIPGDPEHERFRARLLAALTYSAPGYYVGIPCRSDHAERYAHFFDELKRLTRVPEEQLTFARVFHSYNYKRFNEVFLPAVYRRKLFLVCNERADSTTIPNVIRRWNVAAVNASLMSLHIIEEIKAYIADQRLKGGVFLLSPGPSAAIFAHELWSTNRENTYLDIGSTLDPIYFHASPCRGITRIYLRKWDEGQTAKPFEWG